MITTSYIRIIVRPYACRSCGKLYQQDLIQLEETKPRDIYVGVCLSCEASARSLEQPARKEIPPCAH